MLYRDIPAEGSIWLPQYLGQRNTPWLVPHQSDLQWDGGLGFSSGLQSASAMLGLLCCPLSVNANAFCYLLLQSLSGASYPGKAWSTEQVRGKTIGLQTVPFQPALLLWDSCADAGSAPLPQVHWHPSVPKAEDLIKPRAFV